MVDTPTAGGEDMETLLRRRALIAAGTALAPGAIVACQPTSTAGVATPASRTPVTITWLAWAGAGPETEQYQLNASEFTRQLPHITVDWVNGNTVNDNLAKFMAMTAAGTPPNVVQVHYSNCVDLASRGALASLDGPMARDRVRKEDFVPGLADEFAWKRVQYGLPKDNALRVMFLNLDHFERGGVPIPADTWTWDDFLTAATRLTDRTPATGSPVFGVADFSFLLNDSPSYSITRAFGGEWFNETWTAATIDNPATVEAIQFVADWRNRHKISPAPGEIQDSGDAFRRGHVAMGIAFAQQVFFLKQERVSFRYDVLPLPRGRAGAFPCVTGSGQSLAQSAPQPEAGWQFLKYLVGPEAQRRITSLKRWGASRVDSLEAILPEDGVPRNFRAAFLDPLQGRGRDKVVAIPTPPRAKDLEAVYVREFGPVQAGEKTAREAAAATRPLLDEILRQAGGR
jgi:multiple sugar transport system substrate-binding protein